MNSNILIGESGIFVIDITGIIYEKINIVHGINL